MAEQARAIGRAVKGVRDIKVVRAVKSVKDIEVGKVAKGGKDTKAVKVVKSGKDIKVVKAVKGGQDIKAVKIVKGGKDIEKVKVVKGGQDIRAVRAVKSVKSLPARTVADPLRDLQDRLHYRFSNERLLARALTHRSFSADHNERLEFLGDAVLSLAVSHQLLEALQKQPEGDLSRVRAQLVREASLHARALRLGLPSLLRLGEGERRAGGRERPSILADALEAVIGAVYLDGGYAAAQALVGRLLEDVDLTPNLVLVAAARDAKTALQEWLQGRHMALPRYAVAATTGAEHQQTFDVRCTVEALGRQSRGQGASRRAAEQSAAAAMLAQLEKNAS